MKLKCISCGKILGECKDIDSDSWLVVRHFASRLGTHCREVHELTDEELKKTVIMVRERRYHGGETQW